jgi:hypothetical protein
MKVECPHRVQGPVEGDLGLDEAAEAVVGAEEGQQVGRVPDLFGQPAVVGR